MRHDGVEEVVPASFEWCHLWTFTFPDDVAPSVACKRWVPLRDRLDKLGCRCVRVLERGKRGERRWHFHAVTPQRWDVTVIRPIAEKHGFGRVNVKRIPATKAGYIAKYVGKDFRDEDPDRVGVRLWGCVGFKGVVVSNVRTVNKLDASNLDRNVELIDAITYDWYDSAPLTVVLRGRLARPEVGSLVVKTMELKKTQTEELNKLLQQGQTVFVGEYRGYGVRTVGYADRKTGAQITRVVVEHNIEVNGLSRAVTEWLPVGSDGKAAKPAANKGDVVVVIVESMKSYAGTLSIGGTIRSLTQLV